VLGNLHFGVSVKGWRRLTVALVMILLAPICAVVYDAPSAAAVARAQSSPVAEGAQQPASWDPGTGTWSVRNLDGSVATTSWGTAGDVPLVGDVNGDGFDDYVAWRPSNGKWYGLSGTGEVVLDYRWGTAGDIPLLGDVDGDGYDDMVIWRPSNGRWYVRSSKTFRTVMNRAHGGGWLNDVPLIGDLNGDGRDEIIIWRPKTGANNNGRFYAKNFEGKTIFSRAWGAGRLGDIPLIGDVDGNGADDVVIFRPSSGRWYPKSIDNTRPVSSIGLGASGDTPMMFDVDGDGDDDAVITRHYNGKKYWYARNSASQKLPFYGVHHGSDGETALVGNFRGGLFRSASTAPQLRAAGAVQQVRNTLQRIAVNGVEVFERSCTADYESCGPFRSAPELVPGNHGAIRGMSTFVINGDDGKELVEVVVRGDDIYRRTSAVGTTPGPWGAPTGKVSDQLADGGVDAPTPLAWLTTVVVDNGGSDQLMQQAYGRNSYGLIPANNKQLVFTRQSSDHDMVPIAQHGKENWQGGRELSAIIDNQSESTTIIDGVETPDGGYNHGYKNLLVDGDLTPSARLISASWGPNEGNGIHHQASWFEDGDEADPVTKGFYRGTRWTKSLYGGWDPVTEWFGPIYMTKEDFYKENPSDKPLPETIDSIVPIRVTSLQAQASYTIPPSFGSGRQKLVVMGDSYASGEGIVVGNETFCHRDSRAYGSRLATEHNMELQFLACSGATVAQQLDPKDLPADQENQLALLDSDADIVTISLGGNDMLFSAYMKCVVIWPSGCEAEFEPDMDRALGLLKHRWKTLYFEIFRRAPRAKIFAIGYPYVLEASRVSNHADPICRALAYISGAEAAFADQKTAELNTALAEVVNSMASSGWRIEFVNPTDVFDGHGACTGSERWIHNLEVYDPTVELPDMASFHPLEQGHDAYFRAINAALADG